MTDTIRVLITVKAAPEPSKAYGDTVCVAGLRLDGGRSEWVRLYPVPFRYLSSEEKFAKYQIVTVDVNAAKSDSRRESRRPIWGTLQPGPKLSVPERARMLDTMHNKTMCELRAGVRENRDAQSLGLVGVSQMRGMAFEKHPGWSDKQKQAMLDAMHPTLFDSGENREVRPLVPPRFKAFYLYNCFSNECTGHRQSILDIEMSALQYYNRALSDEDLQKLIRQKYQQEKFTPGKRTALFVGNIADPIKRMSFSVLGVYTVPAGSDYSSVLFDLEL
jgi:hypothetical protein